MKANNKNLFKIIKISFLVILCLQVVAGGVLTLWPTKVSAADPVSLEFKPQIKIPGSSLDADSIKISVYDSATGEMNSDLLARYISAFYNYGLAIAGILAAIVLMAGGVLCLPP